MYIVIGIKVCAYQMKMRFTSGGKFKVVSQINNKMKLYVILREFSKLMSLNLIGPMTTTRY